MGYTTGLITYNKKYWYVKHTAYNVGDVLIKRKKGGWKSGLKYLWQEGWIFEIPKKSLKEYNYSEKWKLTTNKIYLWDGEADKYKQTYPILFPKNATIKGKNYKLIDEHFYKDDVNMILPTYRKQWNNVIVISKNKEYGIYATSKKRISKRKKKVKQKSFWQTLWA